MDPSASFVPPPSAALIRVRAARKRELTKIYEPGSVPLLVL